jgi:hypothetical protein
MRISQIQSTGVHVKAQQFSTSHRCHDRKNKQKTKTQFENRNGAKISLLLSSDVNNGRLQRAQKRSLKIFLGPILAQFRLTF